ncbi:unnamed protein product [Closterium sp. NIES-53]
MGYYASPSIPCLRHLSLLPIGCSFRAVRATGGSGGGNGGGGSSTSNGGGRREFWDSNAEGWRRRPSDRNGDEASRGAAVPSLQSQGRGSERERGVSGMGDGAVVSARGGVAERGMGRNLGGGDAGESPAAEWQQRRFPLVDSVRRDYGEEGDDNNYYYNGREYNAFGRASGEARDPRSSGGMQMEGRVLEGGAEEWSSRLDGRSDGPFGRAAEREMGGARGAGGGAGGGGVESGNDVLEPLKEASP